MTFNDVSREGLVCGGLNNLNVNESRMETDNFLKLHSTFYCTSASQQQHFLVLTHM